MKIYSSTHSKARVVGGTVDPNLYFFNPNDEIPQPQPRFDLPDRYFVKVQICLFWFIWVTVWSAEVELTDEAMAAVNKRAEDLADTLSCTGL